MSRQLNPPSKEAHPLVHLIHKSMVEQNVSAATLIKKANISRSAFRGWRNGSVDPALSNMERVLNALGFKLVAQPRLYRMIGIGARK